MLVHQYMTRQVFVARPEDGARTTWGIMQTERIRHMVVIDTHGLIVGLVSDRDLRRPRWVTAQGVEEHFELTDALTVADVMTTEVVGIQTHDPLAHAARLFIERRFGVLPVINEGGELAGMLSIVDVCRATVDLLAPR